MRKNVGLWIDHREAIIVTVNGDGVMLDRIESNAEPKVRLGGGACSRKGHTLEASSESRRDGRLRDQYQRFYDEVIGRIEGAERFLILGPGEAKTEFRKRLEKSKRLSQRLAGIQRADRMTEPQLRMRVAGFFQMLARG